LEAKIDNYSTWIHTADHQSILSDLERLLVDSGFTLLNFVEHHFEPQGYTALWLLGESHCALHTFPEEHKSYIELSSCNTQMYVDFIAAFNKHYNRTN